MYVCMYVCMFACKTKSYVYLYMYVYACEPPLDILKLTCIQMQIHNIYTYTQTHTIIFIYAHSCIYNIMRAHTHYTQTHAYACMHTSSLMVFKSGLINQRTHTHQRAHTLYTNTPICMHVYLLLDGLQVRVDLGHNSLKLLHKGLELLSGLDAAREERGHVCEGLPLGFQFLAV
jgi:hypothetical protein